MGKPVVRRGKGVEGGKAIVKGGQTGLRRITCTRCHGTAVPTRQGDGTYLHVCSCGARYKISTM